MPTQYCKGCIEGGRGWKMLDMNQVVSAGRIPLSLGRFLSHTINKHFKKLAVRGEFGVEFRFHRGFGYFMFLINAQLYVI